MTTQSHQEAKHTPTQPHAAGEEFIRAAAIKAYREIYGSIGNGLPMFIKGYRVAHEANSNPALVAENKRLRTALRRCERVVTWCKESGMEGSQITRALNSARAALAKEDV